MLWSNTDWPAHLSVQAVDDNGSQTRSQASGGSQAGGTRRSTPSRAKEFQSQQGENLPQNGRPLGNSAVHPAGVLMHNDDSGLGGHIQALTTPTTWDMSPFFSQPHCPYHTCLDWEALAHPRFQPDPYIRSECSALSATALRQEERLFCHLPSLAVKKMT